MSDYTFRKTTFMNALNTATSMGITKIKFREHTVYLFEGGRCSLSAKPISLAVTIDGFCNVNHKVIGKQEWIPYEY